MPTTHGWGDAEDDILRAHPHQRKAAQRALRDAGFHRSYAAVCQRAVVLGLTNLPKPKPQRKRRPKHTPGAGRTRQQNAALWRLAERRPTPSEYAHERARILREDEP